MKDGIITHPIVVEKISEPATIGLPKSSIQKINVIRMRLSLSRRIKYAVCRQGNVD